MGSGITKHDSSNIKKVNKIIKTRKINYIPYELNSNSMSMISYVHMSLSGVCNKNKKLINFFN